MLGAPPLEPRWGAAPDPAGGLRPLDPHFGHLRKIASRFLLVVSGPSKFYNLLISIPKCLYLFGVTFDNSIQIITAPGSIKLMFLVRVAKMVTKGRCILKLTSCPNRLALPKLFKHLISQKNFFGPEYAPSGAHKPFDELLKKIIFDPP